MCQGWAIPALKSDLLVVHACQACVWLMRGNIEKGASSAASCGRFISGTMITGRSADELLWPNLLFVSFLMLRAFALFLGTFCLFR